MSKQWFVVGISGTTCSGKTTLAEKLSVALPGSIFIRQDDYFHPVDSPHHTWVEELGHINWEIMTALNMNEMHADVKNILSQNPSSAVLPQKAKRSTIDLSSQANTNSVCFSNLLILEGFLLLNDPVLFSLCDLRYYLTLTREQCWERRRNRVYDPPDIPGYFDMIVWPEYVKHRDAVLSLGNVKIIDGMTPADNVLSNVVMNVKHALSVL